MDKRVEKNIESIKNLKKFLIYIIENAQLVLVEFPDIYAQLSTQHLLANFENEKWGIAQSSLNTLKRISPRVFDNGFDDLEKLRSFAVEKLENHLKVSERRHLNKNDKIKQLENEIEKLERMHLICLNQILEDLNTFKNIENINSLELAKKISEKATAKIRSLGLYSEKIIDLTKNDKLRVVK